MFPHSQKKFVGKEIYNIIFPLRFEFLHRQNDDSLVETIPGDAHKSFMIYLSTFNSKPNNKDCQKIINGQRSFIFGAKEALC